MIRARTVRVIDPEGNQLGVLPIEEALRLSDEAELDLVEVAPAAQPPVCRIMNYGKFKYQQSKKLHQSKKKHSQSIIHIKEIKIRPKTEEHDFQFKVRHIKKFLSQGDKTKISLVFRGREITHPELGKEVLDRITEEIKDIGVVEQPPKLEGRNMIMMLAPKS